MVGATVFVVDVGVSGPDGFWMCLVFAVNVLDNWIFFLDELTLWPIHLSLLEARSRYAPCCACYMNGMWIQHWNWAPPLRWAMYDDVEWRAWVLKSSSRCLHTRRISLKCLKRSQWDSSGDSWRPLGVWLKLFVFVWIPYWRPQVHTSVHLNRSAVRYDETMGWASKNLAFSHIQSHYFLVSALLLPSAWISYSRHTCLLIVCLCTVQNRFSLMERLF